MIRLFPLAVAALISTAHAGSVSFEKDVVPILNSYCVMCHLPGGEQGGLSLYPDAWSELVGILSKQSTDLTGGCPTAPFNERTE
jgi:hypothetical protein